MASPVIYNPGNEAKFEKKLIDILLHEDYNLEGWVEDDKTLRKGLIINQNIIKKLGISTAKNGEWSFDNWSIEVPWNRIFSDSTYKDRIDILFYNEKSQSLTMIETDSSRADQVGKKFSSRLALTISCQKIKTLNYISYCYVASRDSDNEVSKYFNYCSILAEAVKKSDFEVFFLGIYPNQVLP